VTADGSASLSVLLLGAGGEQVLPGLSRRRDRSTEHLVGPDALASEPAMQGRVYQPTPGEGQPWSIAYHSADWVSGARRRFSRSGFPTLKEAEAALARAEADAEAGVDAVRPAQRSVADFLRDEWLPTEASKDLDPEVLERYRSAVEQWIVPQVGAVELARLTPKTIRGLYDTLRVSGATWGAEDTTQGGEGATQGSGDSPGGEGAAQAPDQSAPPNVQLTADVLRRALGHAVTEGLIPRNPATVVDPDAPAAGASDPAAAGGSEDTPNR